MNLNEGFIIMINMIIIKWSRHRFAVQLPPWLVLIPLMWALASVPQMPHKRR